MAAEIECYVEAPDAEMFFAPILIELKKADVSLIRIEKERGEHQYEFVTHVTTPLRLCRWLETIKATVAARASTLNVIASFAAKPYAGQPSSGLHIHTHLGSAEEGINAYHKTDEWISDALRWSLGGLLQSLPTAMPIFFPNQEAYVRLQDADHVPRTASWGVNNRYCALRIPANEDPYDKRIEHRVPCADADVDLSILAVLEGITLGLEQTIEPPAQEFGKPAAQFVHSLSVTPLALPLTASLIS